VSNETKIDQVKQNTGATKQKKTSSYQ